MRAVQQQSLQKSTPGNMAAFEAKVVEYESNGQQVKLSPAIVRQYLVNGQGNVSDQEVAMFINLCKYQHLNPFLREAYLIKYGDSNPASLVTGKDTFEKRAYHNKSFVGKQAGVIVLNPETGEIENRVGSFTLEGEEIVGGWAKVYVKGYDYPVETSVSFNEYCGRKKDGTINGQWATKPGTMIRKVALVQALREAFPDDYSGLYSQEEVNIDDELPTNNIVQPQGEPIAPQEVTVLNSEPTPTIAPEDDDPLGE